MTEIDFSKLDALSMGADFREEEPPEPPKATAELHPLQAQADHNKGELERARNIFREYQTQRATVQGELSKLRKGITEGDSIYRLFLQAIGIIGALTHEPELEEQTKAQILAIYGMGLHEREPLAMELDAVQDRLSRLTAAHGKADPDEQERIEKAIRKHKEKKTYIESLIQ